MNDQDTSASGVRRVTPKDRKPDLSSGGLQFPPPDDTLPELPSDEDRFPPLPPEPKRRSKTDPPPPAAAAPTPMTESEKRFPDLANFPVDESPLPFDDFDDSPPVITPPEERFPPLPTAADLIEAPMAEPRFDEPIPGLEGEPDILSPAPKRSGGGWQNAVALIFLLAAIVIFAVGMLIFNDPYGPFNPFPPATPPPIYVTATFSAPVAAPGATATFTPLPPAVLTEMAPAKSATEEAAAPLPTTLPENNLIDATAVQPTTGAVIGGG